MFEKLKILIQISSEDNKPFKKISFQAKNGAQRKLGDYSEQVWVEDPGRGEHAVFFINSKRAKKIRLNWWVGH